MRKVRGGKRKYRGINLNPGVFARDNWFPYLLIFLCGLLGILSGFLIGKIATPFLVLIIVVFVAIIIAGLFIAWTINQKDQILELSLIHESLKTQYNAFVLLINELEYNLALDEGSLRSDNAWQKLKFELAFFPNYLYEELNYIYHKLSDSDNLKGNDYRQFVFEDLELPLLIAKLRDCQQKIRRQLPYIN